MVPTLPTLPPPPGDGPRPPPDPTRRRPPHPLHPRRTDGSNRRLPGDPPRTRSTGPRTGHPRPAGTRTLARTGGLVPLLRRKPDPQPGNRPPPRRRTRRRNANRLPARPVRTRRAATANPAPGRDRARMRLARSTRSGAHDGVLVAGTRRHGGAHTLPTGGRIRRRSGSLHGARPNGGTPARRGACASPATLAAERPAAGHVRDRSLGAGGRTRGLGGGRFRGAGGGADSARYARGFFRDADRWQLGRTHRQR